MIIAMYISKFQERANLIGWDNAILIFYFRKILKYIVEKKLIYYRRKFNSLNILIEVAIKLNYKFYKLAMKIGSGKANNKGKLYFRYINYCN